MRSTHSKIVFLSTLAIATTSLDQGHKTNTPHSQEETNHVTILPESKITYAVAFGCGHSPRSSEKPSNSSKSPDIIKIDQIQSSKSNQS
jgi:hypothetical protein